MSLSIGTAWNETAALARREPAFLYLTAFFSMALPAAILQLIAPVTAPGGVPEPGPWLLFVPLLLAASLIGALAISRLALSEGEGAAAAFGAGFRGFFPLLGAVLLILLGGAAVAIAAALLVAVVAAPLLSILLRLLLLALLVFFWSRLILLTPAAATESIGPIQLIRRSWALSAGHVPRLVAILMVAALASLLALIAAGALGGVAARLGPGQPQPGMPALVLVLLVSALLQAAIGGLVTAFVARLYVQLARGDPAGPSLDGG